MFQKLISFNSFSNPKFIHMIYTLSETMIKQFQTHAYRSRSGTTHVQLSHMSTTRISLWSMCEVWVGSGTTPLSRTYPPRGFLCEACARFEWSNVSSQNLTDRTVPTELVNMHKDLHSCKCHARWIWEDIVRLPKYWKENSTSHRNPSLCRIRMKLFWVNCNQARWLHAREDG